MYSDSAPLHSALCTLHSALCTLHSALCTLHSALCTPLLFRHLHDNTVNLRENLAAGKCVVIGLY